MKRAKPKKNKKKKQVTMTQSRYYQMKREVSHDLMDRAILLVLKATADEKDLTFDEICGIAIRTNRYADHIEEELVELRQFQKSLEATTGYKYKGW